MWFRAALLVCLAGCAPQFQVEGRPYALGVPPSVTEPLPLVVLLHGYGVSADAQEVALPFSRDVAARRFFYAMPNGTLDAKGKRFWNATDACCNDGALPVDDVGFLRAVIADVKAHHPGQIDPDRVFLIGHSNGGFMALRMACEAGDVVTGVMSLAGAAPLVCAGGPAVATLLVHGTGDDVIRFGGGVKPRARYPSAEESRSILARHNGCGADEAPGLAAADFIGDAKQETSGVAAAHCPPGGKAELWTVEGEGHIPFFNDAFRTAVLDWLFAEAR